MKNVTPVIAGCCFVFAFLAGTVSSADDRVPVAIMEFTTKGGVTQKQMDALEDLLADTVRDLGAYRVIGSNDIRSVIMTQEKKMLLGCNQTECMAEIGGALGVRWIVVGNVSKFGEVYLLNIKMLDAEKVKVVASESLKVTGGEAELVDAVPIATRKVFEKAGPLMLGKKAAGTQAASTGAQPPGAGITRAAAEKPMPAMKKWGHVTFWSGLGCLAIGGVSLGLGKAAADRYREGDISAWDTSRNWTGVGFAALGVGAALAITGVVLWSLSPSENEGSVAVVPVLDGRGAVLGVAGRF